jgi:hypothetical protein
VERSDSAVAYRAPKTKNHETKNKEIGNQEIRDKKNRYEQAEHTAQGAGAAKQLSAFIAKFDPDHQALIRSVRKVLRNRLPSAHELVYDNYNFFVIGYCSSERPSDCIVSIAAGAGGVGLSFYRGADVPDPHKLLLGSGTQNRFIRLESAKTLSDPQVAALITAAISQAKTPLPIAGTGKLTIRSISAKQRPRRKAKK